MNGTFQREKRISREKKHILCRKLEIRFNDKTRDGFNVQSFNNNKI